MLDLNTIHHGDGFDLMRHMPDGSDKCNAPPVGKGRSFRVAFFRAHNRVAVHKLSSVLQVIYTTM